MVDMFHMKQVCVLGCQKEFKIWHILGFFSKRGKVQVSRCWMERELGYLGCLRDLGAEQPTIAVVSIRGIGPYCIRVQHSSVGSALACCTAGPSSNPGSAPQGGFSR
jgi:hypothetical protein